MGPYDKGFTNTLWTHTIVMGPYDKEFTNTFWTETLVMGPYDKGFYKYFVDTEHCHWTAWQGFKHFVSI